MCGDVVVQNSAPAHLQYDKYVQNTETGRDHDEKVARDDGLSVVPDERKPAVGRIGCRPRSDLADYREALAVREAWTSTARTGEILCGASGREYRA